VEQQFGAEAPSEDRPVAYRFIILQRSVSHAVRLTRERAPLAKQILGWSVVAGIFIAALGCWGVVILTATILYRAL